MITKKIIDNFIFMKKAPQIAILLILIFLISCNKNKNMDIKKYNVVQKKYKGSDFEIQFNFPDTLYKDSSYVSAIFYNNVIDTINNKLNDNTSRKTDFFYKLGKDNFPIKDKEIYQKDNNLDTIFGFIKNSKNIFFSDKFRFDKLGDNYINGVVVDSVLINVDDEKVRVVEMKYRILHKLYIIEK